MTKDEAMRLALEAITHTVGLTQKGIDLKADAIAALQEALAQDHSFDHTASHNADEYVCTCEKKGCEE